MMESLSVEVVLVVVGVVVVIVVHCLDDVKSGTQILCSQSSIRFVRLKLSKTLPKTPHLFTTYLIPSYFFHFFPISFLSQSSS
jgi:hypothetical protein